MKNPTRITNFDVNRINIVGVTAVLVILVMKFVSEMLLKVTEMVLKVTEMWYVKMAGKNSRRVKNEITHNSRQNTKLPPRLKTPAKTQNSRQKMFFPPKNILPPKIKNCQFCDISRYSLY